MVPVMRIAVMIVLLAATHARAETVSYAVEIAGKDARSAKTAASLANGLRAAGRGKASYRAKGSAKEIAAAIAKAECAIVQPACAATVGTALGVDYIFVGEVELRASRPTAVINVISVKTKRRVRSVRDVAALRATPQAWAKAIYRRLVDDATGELHLSSNVERGVVLVDGQPVTELFERRATVQGLALGTHQLSIRAAGYQPFEMEITIDGTTKVSALVDKPSNGR